MSLTAADLDDEIEKKTGKTIESIFKENGEAYFRQTETEALRHYATQKDFVLATGGGTPCFHGNMDWMNQFGITVWLNEPISVLVQRLVEGKAHRPLISTLSNDELASFLHHKLLERVPFYQKAAYHIQPSEIEQKGLASFFKEIIRP